MPLEDDPTAEVCWQFLREAGFTGQLGIRCELASTVNQVKTAADRSRFLPLPDAFDSLTTAEDTLLHLITVILSDEGSAEARAQGANLLLGFLKQLRAMAAKKRGGSGRSIPQAAWREMATHTLAAMYWYCLTGGYQGLER